MSPVPVILVTCSGLRSPQADLPRQPETTCQADHGRQRGCLKDDYLRCLQQVGAAPVLVPNAPDVALAVAALRLAGGLLLTGGWDIDPAAYGQQRAPEVQFVDPVRDTVELALVAESNRRRLPILGICRGHQMLAVALGGTLRQHILGHRSAEPVGHGAPIEHPLRTQPGSLIERLWGKELTVNSSHHQAVDRLPPAVHATAWARDGTIEAIEPDDNRPLLGVQAHPEMLADRPPFLNVFHWLAEQARKRMAARA